ncbi:DUF1294 domain-containing protein [Shewanella sp. MMG014]|uniref:DUF1294 domain-containing protein n=1 Tax=Shewanella sp. MMG014 TaxID=2822691 RepID=UPI001B392E15|nr:DUF1294 domain-containing protein [Shewanella sp. MMG014]MBQ4888713.1 DUF1294 domain-containing protein [Shewanella sp. MMG014]
MKLFGLISCLALIIASFSLSSYLGYYVLFINLICAAVTWHDKRAASKQTWRVKERTLYILAFIGAWPAGVLAQQYFRHKTQKTPFKWIYWVMIVLNILLVISMCYLQLRHTGIN